MPVKVYLSNIARQWPLGKQESLFAEKVPGWPDVATYCDSLKSGARKAHNAASLKERASMLRPTARRTADETIYVASLPCLAWGVADFSDVLASFSERGATLTVLDSGLVIPPNAGAKTVAVAVKAFTSAKRTVTGGGPKVGALASAATRRAASDAAIEAIKGRWSLPTKEYPTWLLLAEAKLSRNTVVERLGKRPAAQRAYQAKLKREAKRKSASMSSPSGAED